MSSIGKKVFYSSKTELLFYSILFFYCLYLLYTGYTNFFSGIYSASGGDTVINNEFHYNAFLGKPFIATFPGGEWLGGNYSVGFGHIFTIHIYLTSYLFLPILYFFYNPFTYLGIETLWIYGLGGILFYKILQDLYDDEFAFFGAILYLVFPPLFNVLSMFQCHDLSITPSLMMFYALQKRKYILYWLGFILLLGTVEIYAITAFFIGLYAWFGEGKRNLGLYSMFIALLYLVLALYVQKYFASLYVESGAINAYNLNKLDKVMSLRSIFSPRPTWGLIIFSFLLSPFVFFGIWSALRLQKVGVRIFLYF